MSLDRETAGRLRRQLHDINNALNSIMMQSELVKLHCQGIELNPDALEALDVILSECRNAGALTQSAGALIREKSASSS